MAKINKCFKSRPIFHGLFILALAVASEAKFPNIRFCCIETSYIVLTMILQMKHYCKVLPITLCKCSLTSMI